MFAPYGFYVFKLDISMFGVLEVKINLGYVTQVEEFFLITFKVFITSFKVLSMIMSICRLRSQDEFSFTTQNSKSYDFIMFFRF